MKTLKLKVNFCNSSLKRKQKLCDKYEPREIVVIGVAIGVGVGLSLDLVFKAVPRGLLGTYCRSRYCCYCCCCFCCCCWCCCCYCCCCLVIVGDGGAVAAAVVFFFVVVVVVVIVVVVAVATGAIVDFLQLLINLIFKRYCVLLLLL